MPTEGRSIKKTGYHAAMERGGAPTFEMPPEGYVPHPELAGPKVQTPVSDPMRAAFEAAPMGQELMEKIDEVVVDPRVQEIYSDQSIPQDAQQSSEDVLDSFDAQEESPPAPVKVSTQQENFRSLRMENDRIARENERIARERDEIRLQMLEMQQRQMLQPVQQQPVEVEEQFQFEGDEDSFADNRQLKKMALELFNLKKQLKNQDREFQQVRQKTEQTTLELELKSRYPDFAAVFNEQNVADLKSKHPQIAQALGSIPDKYERSVAAYTMMKNLGLGVSTLDTDLGYVQKAKAAINVAKPRPLTSLSPSQGSPINRANAFIDSRHDKAMRDKMIKEMDDARRRA